MSAAAEVPPVVVTMRPESRKKVTGWELSCEVHGRLPFLVKTRMKAIRTAGLHLRNEHGARGRIVERGPLRSKKVRRRAA